MARRAGLQMDRNALDRNALDRVVPDRNASDWNGMRVDVDARTRRRG